MFGEEMKSWKDVDVASFGSWMFAVRVLLKESRGVKNRGNIFL